MICVSEPLAGSGSIPLNGNPVVVDLDFHAVGLLPVLIDHITQNHDGYAEHSAEGVKRVTAHRLNRA